MPAAKTTDQYWSDLYKNGRDFSLVTSDALSKILSYANDALPKICLDIGCGTGQLTRELYHRGYTCAGIDAAEQAIEIAKSLTNVSPNRLTYTQLDIEQNDDSKLPTQQYSLITCKLVYAFMHDKPAFLKKVKHILAPGGLFVIITPHVDDLPADRQGIGVNHSELALLEAYFVQLALYKGNDTLTYFIGR